MKNPLAGILAALAFLGITAQAANEERPNIILIMSDDQGWGDLSIHGNINLATPHVDSLARDGVSFENFYVCAVCAPTRAEFLSGRYHPRTGVGGVSRGEGRLNPNETTIADIFKKAGYITGAFGKWHNGTQTPYHPNDRGFDEFYGFTSGHWGHYFSPPLDHNGRRVRGKGYVVDDFTDHALRFIKEHRDKPFLCYIPYNTPHSPMMVDDRFYQKFEDVNPGMRHRDPEREDVMMTRAALAMCENIDWNVGRILKQLDELKLRDKTIVLYFCDNGPNSYRWNGGMKGRKGSVDEGGLRSPLFIRWPARINPGSHVKQVVGAIDLLPSLTSLTGIPARTAKPMDGVSFKPLLDNQTELWKERDLFSLWGKKASVRTERFRLDSAGKLYDIGKDRGQRINVSSKHPAEAERLKAVLAQHRVQMTREYAPFKDRPFTVGYGRSTTLPARDGIEHGSIERSAKAPNNSFFKNWENEDDSITWKVDIGQTADYEATVYYTCAKENTGVRIRIALDGHKAAAEAEITQAFDPPLYDKSKERVAESHYFQKDFKPFKLGTLRLKKGKGLLRLTAPKIVGTGAIDVYSIKLDRK